MKTNTFLGAIALVAGTSIGGAILSLPVSTAAYGFLPTLLLLLACWAFMTYSALLLIEVNAHCNTDANLITMARTTLGWPGVCLTWTSYLLLLYALMAAYVSGLSAMLVDVSNIMLSHPLSIVWSASILTAAFGALIYAGARPLDLLNRGLMVLLLIAFCIIIGSIVPHLDMQHLHNSGNTQAWEASGIVITSFGFAIIIPSLRRYGGDAAISKLPKAVLWGSAIPLVAYIIWIATMRAAIPAQGPHGLLHILATGQPATGLVHALTHRMHFHGLTVAFEIFTWAIITTSFIGVSLSLFDCLQDGCGIKKHRKGRLCTAALTMVPPAVFAKCYPAGFMLALHYASFFVAILLGILPALMAWQARRQFSGAVSYRAPGGWPLLAANVLFFIAIIVFEIKALH